MPILRPHVTFTQAKNFRVGDPRGRQRRRGRRPSGGARTAADGVFGGDKKKKDGADPC
ncbi:MAG: hypothetical protein R3A52_23225 [Polyangiales bacterium]